jgi:Phosphoesterase family
VNRARTWQDGRVRPRVLLGLALLTLASAGYALARTGFDGRIGPKNRVQPSGRKLRPVGKLTKVGNHPAGAALTTNGSFYWTVSAGRGRNDIRIVQVASRIRCKKPRRPHSISRSASRRARVSHQQALRRYRRALQRYRRCAKRRSRQIGRVVQTIPMPGASGGIAMAPDGRTAYVSGVPESEHKDQQTPAGTPGKQGDVIHVFTYDGRTGLASRAGIIPVPPPSFAPTVQDFPPHGAKESWPQQIAVSRDGKRLLVALDLADGAAIVDTATKNVRYVQTGHYPYGAGITSDGKFGLVSNQTPGTVSVIDMASGAKRGDIQVGPHLSHPEGIAVDPKLQRAYVAVTNQDVLAVIDTKNMTVARTLSVGRPQGIGTAPVGLNVTRDGCFLLSADSGEDAVAVFALPNARRATCRNDKKRRSRSHGANRSAASVLTQAAPGVQLARRSRAWQLVGRVPVASYPVAAEAGPGRKSLVWLAAKGLGVGPNPNGPVQPSPYNNDDNINHFQYLPSIVRGTSGVAAFPTNTALQRLNRVATREIHPIDAEKAPAGTPIRKPGPGQKIKHVFYIVRENRTYDQVMGDDRRGDGDPNLTLFGSGITPNAHALARRFPLLDHVYANSEASIDGHFWTSAGAVSDYVVKAWHQNYAARARPYDFGVYSVSWPAAGFLFDRAESQHVSYFNYGEALAGVVYQLGDKDRTSADLQEQLRKASKTDINTPATAGGCYPNDASIGTDALLGVETYDSSLPAGAPAGAISRFDCFKRRFDQQLSTGNVPAFNYLVLPSDHTNGSTPGRRTPRAMVAENDYALGQIVDLISHSSIWRNSLIEVIEDDSQDGADHVDAHRIPALVISPYARRGTVVHHRYDFLSFIRTLEIVTGMKPLNLFDALGVPLYDAFSSSARNSAPYTAIGPRVNLVERNTASSPAARASERYDLTHPDRIPQRELDRILWKSIHGAGAHAPPPGPNATRESDDR